MQSLIVAMLYHKNHTHQKNIVKAYYNSIGLEVVDKETDFLITKEHDARNSFFNQIFDWLLILDSDEILLKEDIDKLKQQMEKDEHNVFRSHIIDYLSIDKIVPQRTHLPIICVKNPVKYNLKYRFDDKRCTFDVDREMITLQDINLHHLGYLGNCQNKINSYMQRSEFAEVATVKRIKNCIGEQFETPATVKNIIEKIMAPDE